MYHYRQRMIPSFLPAPLVRKIFDCGKTIHFIRDTIQDFEWAPLHVDEAVKDQCSIEDVSRCGGGGGGV